METFITPDDIFLPYPQSPLLSGPTILMDVLIPKEESLLVSQERFHLQPSGGSNAVTVTLLLQIELSLESEYSQEIAAPIFPGRYRTLTDK